MVRERSEGKEEGGEQRRNNDMHIGELEDNINSITYT